MTDLQFNEPEYARRASSAGNRSFLANLMIRTGLAKDDAGAQKALVVVLIIVLALIVMVNWPRHAPVQLPQEGSLNVNP